MNLKEEKIYTIHVYCIYRIFGFTGEPRRSFALMWSIHSLYVLLCGALEQHCVWQQQTTTVINCEVRTLWQ